MGLKEVERVPEEAQVLEQNPLPDGRIVQVLFAGGQEFRRFVSPDGEVERTYRVEPDEEPVRRCRARHPSHPKQVRCEEPAGHTGQHFNSFFMRSWDTTDDLSRSEGTVNR